MCNIQTYLDWRTETYGLELHPPLIQALVRVDRSNKKLWNAMNFESTHKDFLAGRSYPTNGQVMDASGIICRQSFGELEKDFSGTHSDSDIMNQGIYDTMCSSHCLINDRMRIAAMNITGCSCLDFSASGDWCRESSGHQLCDETGMCGEWKCALNDFQCKRKEYNTIYVPLKGYGGQCSSAMKIRLKWGVIALLFSSTLMAR